MKMNKYVMLILALMITIACNSQTQTINKKLKLTVTPEATSTDSLLAIQPDGLIVKTGITVGSVGGASELSDLNDVTSATQTAGFALMSNGGAYFGRAITESDISGLSHFIPSTLLTDYGFTDNSSNWNTAYNDRIVSAVFTGTTTKTLTLTKHGGGTITANFNDIGGTGGDGNDFVDNGSFNSTTGNLTLNVTNQADVVISLDNAIANEQLKDVSSFTLKGRVTAGTGSVEDLTPTQARSILNVEDGADVTDALNVNEAGAVMNDDTSTGPMSFVLDEDDMVSDSDVKLATQQSIKAYVDNSVAAINPSNFVTTNTTQTITGIKTFDIGSSYFTINGEASGSSGLRIQRSGVDRLTITPEASGPPFVSMKPTSGMFIYSEDGNPIIISNATTNLNVSQLNTLSNKALMSREWIEAQNFQSSITLTTTGSSGPATLVGSTLNIPQYSGGGEATTVSDTAEIDLTLTGVDITAAIVPGSIDETRLDTSTNASLDLADSALQSGDNISSLANDVGYTINEGTVTSIAIGGNDGIEVDSGSPITTSGVIQLGLNKVATLSFLNVEDGADVTDATNVDAAGAVMNSDTSSASMSFVVDEDNMASNSSTKLPTQQSVKAYVDTTVAAGSYTDEQAQDAVGGILTDTAEIDVTYNDTTPSITASIVAGSIDETKLDTSTNASLDLADSSMQVLEDDANPNLGGDLVLNGSDITGTGNIDYTGFLRALGTGRFGATGATRVGFGDLPGGGLPGLWMGANVDAPTYSNYMFLYDAGGGGTLFNSPAGQNMGFRIDNSAKMVFSAGGGINMYDNVINTGSFTASSFIDSSGTTSSTGTTISLADNITGTIYNKATPSTADSFTITGSKTGGFATLYIDTTGDTAFPAIKKVDGTTDADKLAGSPFIASKIYKVIIYTNDNTINNDNTDDIDYFFILDEDSSSTILQGEDLQLFDSADGDYGSIILNDGAYYFENANGQSMLDLDDSGTLTIHDVVTGFTSQISGTYISENRSYILPDASGIIKLDKVEATWKPSTGTTVTVNGIPRTAVGTISHPAITTTSFATVMPRWRNTSAATSNSVADERGTSAYMWRGNAAFLGGFEYATRIAVVTSPANSRAFFGLSSSTSAFSTTQDPAALTNIVGIGYDAAVDTNYQIYYNDGTGTATKVDLGVSYPITLTDAITVIIVSEVNGSGFGIKVYKNGEGAGIGYTALTTNIPSNTTLLAPRNYMNNGGTASACVFDTSYVEIKTVK